MNSSIKSGWFYLTSLLKLFSGSAFYSKTVRLIVEENEAEGFTILNTSLYLPIAFAYLYF